MKKIFCLSHIVLLFAALSLFTSCKSSKTIARADKKPTISTASQKKINDAVKAAKSYIGVKYKFGAMSKSGMDCSGLMCASYKDAGVSIPRTSAQQSTFGKRVYIGELQKGDLVFFGAKNGSKKITHVGMIISVSKESIKFIHASSSRGVTESELLSNYYRPKYIKAVRPVS